MKYILPLFFLSFFLFNSCSREAREIKVALQPMGEYDKSLLDTLEKAIERYYGFQVLRLPAREMQERYFINEKSPRYRADSLIRYLRRFKPDSVDYILGFTSFDISTTKRDWKGRVLEPESRYRDWGIFGLGFRPGSSCMVSNFRLKGKGRLKEIERVKKVCLHELGHNLGLKHCPNEKCFMRDAAESIKTIDGVELNLCEDCKNRI